MTKRNNEGIVRARRQEPLRELRIGGAGDRPRRGWRLVSAGTRSLSVIRPAAPAALGRLGTAAILTSLFILVILASLSVGLWPDPATAGTTGKISGQVLDEAGQPLNGATVVLVGRPLGAYADAEGNYTILNVPPGTYDVSFSFIGYRGVTIRDLVVSADLTTRADARLTATEVALQEVVVVAERPVVDVNLTSSRASLTSEQIQQLPVQELQDVVNLQAGVVDGHFRGGRQGEVQYQIDGVSANNLYDNSSTLRLSRSLLQEVQVISGTFDAEYGQAMSGVVNAVLREGSDKLQWSAEAFTGGYVFPGRDSRLTEDSIRPLSNRYLDVSLSGPVGSPENNLLLSANYYSTDSHLRGTRLFRPDDRADFEQGLRTPTGDGKEVALGWSKEYTGVAKYTNRSLPGLRFSYQAIYNRIRARAANWNFRFNPEGQKRQKTWALVHGVDLNYTVNASSFATFSVRQSLFDYRDRVYEDAWDARYDSAGPVVSDPTFENGAVVQGVDFGRFHQRTNGIVLKASATSQITREHNVKAGAEVLVPAVSFGTTEHLRYASVGGVSQLLRYEDQPPDFPGVKTYHPLYLSAYGQDQIEWTDLTLRAGLRLDYFDARARVPSDPGNPANAIAGAPLSHPRRTSVKSSLSPRLGVAYPINESTGLHFAYGHFYQMPGIGDLFANSDYRILDDLQAGAVSYGTLGNPDIKPERTVQYEFGFKHAFTRDFGFDTSFFYKDIRDLIGVEFISMYNAADYARLTNVDFGSVIGFTVTLDQKDFGLLSTSLDYTWQRALGNSSDPRETAVRASAGEDPRPRQVPLNWDQRHTLNLTATLARPRVFTVSAVIRAASGQPYTPVLDTGFGAGLEANSGRKPAGFLVDLRGERPISFGGVSADAFLRIFNLFDTRSFNGFVFNSTGSPYYSRFPITDAAILGDASRFYPPRRIEIGIRLGTMATSPEEENS